MALARCFTIINVNDKAMALNAGRSSNAMRSWAPYDFIDDDKMIGKYKKQHNEFHVESPIKTKGYTLNCFRLYHSKELNEVVKEVITENSEHNWYQYN